MLVSRRESGFFHADIFREFNLGISDLMQVSKKMSTLYFYADISKRGSNFNADISN